jgi:hypothetical protein
MKNPAVPMITVAAMTVTDGCFMAGYKNWFAS